MVAIIWFCLFRCSFQTRNLIWYMKDCCGLFFSVVENRLRRISKFLNFAFEWVETCSLLWSSWQQNKCDAIISFLSEGIRFNEKKQFWLLLKQFTSAVGQLVIIVILLNDHHQQEIISFSSSYFKSYVNKMVHIK